jgi:hypothetical protein
VKNILFIYIILVLTSCHTTKHVKLSTSVDEDKILFYSKFLFSDSSQVAHFECENFATEALNKYTIATINKEFLTFLNCSKKSVINKYNSSVIDTIYTFSNNENKILIYRAKQNDFIFIFDVTDSKLKLTGNIKPGMTKDLFSQKFHITEKINNKVQIVNSQGTVRFMFYFENNMLKRINSFLYLD